jgi:hypothetical protein
MIGADMTKAKNPLFPGDGAHGHQASHEITDLVILIQESVAYAWETTICASIWKGREMYALLLRHWDDKGGSKDWQFSANQENRPTGLGYQPTTTVAFWVSGGMKSFKTNTSAAYLI